MYYSLLIFVPHEDLPRRRNTLSSHMSYLYCQIDIAFFTPKVIQSHQNPFGMADKGE